MMHGKFTAGILIGTALGMAVHTSRSAKRKMKRTSRFVKNAAGNMMSWIK